MKHLIICMGWLGLLAASLPALAEATAGTVAPELGWWAHHATLGSVLAGIIGFALGAGLVRRWASKHYHRIIHHTRQKAREEAEHTASLKTAKTVQPPTDYEFKLRKENEELKHKLQQLNTQLATQQPAEQVLPPKASLPVTTEPAKAPATEPIAAPPGSGEELLGGAEAVLEEEATFSATNNPSTARYAPAQETGFLRDNKLAAEPLPQLPICLTVSEEDSEKATFTLNPLVNQAKLIGDGLHHLREFFEFDLPTGRIAAVSADAPGQLARQGDGWQVVSRARLLVH